MEHKKSDVRKIALAASSQSDGAGPEEAVSCQHALVRSLSPGNRLPFFLLCGDSTRKWRVMKLECP